VFETKTEELLRPESSWDERNPCLGAVSGNLVRKIPDLYPVLNISTPYHAKV
jgi:hypothetical protein